MAHKNSRKKKVWVLLSGGIDSSACLAFYLEEGFSVNGVFVDYGQLAAHQEKESAENIAKHYRIKLEKIEWSGLRHKNAGLIQGRNAFLLMAALMEIPKEVGTLAIGIHSGTSYVDCAPVFVCKMQSIFDMYTNGSIQIGTPFLKWTKRDIWDFCKSRKVPVGLSYSCEKGLSQPCGKCLSCRDLEKLYACT